MKKLAPADFPPYGPMWADYERAARKNTKPEDFRPGSGGLDWEAWVDDLARVLGDALWPRWEKGAWVGKARQDMADLTAEEIPLAVAFAKAHFREVAWPGAAGPWMHRDFFEMEDEGGWDQTLVRYCPALLPYDRGIDQAIRFGLDQKASALDLVLKQRLQRPRIHQLVEMTGGPTGYRRRTSRSASTPSIVSGHTFQALVAGCTVRLSLERADPQLARRLAAPIARWMTDIGDRRVMAGLHYPSDSIGSWVVAHRLASRVFREPGVAKAMAQAIRGGLLYGFLDESLRAGRGLPALRRAWKFLQAELR